MRQSVWGARLKGIRRQRRGDKVIRYHRASGVRLPDGIPETHPDFIAAYLAAERKEVAVTRSRRAEPGTLAALVVSALRAWERESLSAEYMQMLRRHCDAIRADYGHVQPRAIRSRHVEADISALTPNVANDRLKAWRRIMKHGKATGEVLELPTVGIEKRAVRTDGHSPWSADDIMKFRARWPIGTVARACFELTFWTAARTNDAVKLGPRNIGSDGVLSFRQGKTGGMAFVPWSSPLPLFAKGWDSERYGVKSALECLSGGFTFLEARGRVRSIKGIGNVINDGARAAGLKNRTAHGLRKSRLTMIAEAGGSAHAIMAWGGHKTLAEVEEYTRSAAMKRLILGAEQTEDSVELSHFSR